MDLIASQIQRVFGIQVDSIQHLKGGHINASFFVKEKNGELSVVQKLNQHVFPMWKNIEHNLLLTQTVLHQHHSLGLIPHFYMVNGSIHQEQFDGIWRRMEYIPGKFEEHSVDSSSKAFHAAKSFAQFSQILSQSFNSLNWKEVIPQFHNLESRKAQFENAIKEANRQRKEAAESVILGYQNGLNRLGKVVPILNFRRITHNDAKVSNVLFRNGDLNDAVVIDLDTVMPGSVLFDLGDLIRTFVPQKPEGDFSNSRQVVQQNILDSLLAGYLDGWNNQLTTEEKEFLPFAGSYMTLLIGLRFLTDYLENDHYFKVETENQNLLRAMNQLELFELLL
jgi:thiamine kinase-like enzyme